MAVIIMKFGGTSVAEPSSREIILNKIKQELDAKNNPVVVVSAMGRRGAPYATDTLLDMVPGADADLSALIASCGEIISACVVANSLKARGIPAKAMTAYTAGIMAEGPYDAAIPVNVQTANLEALMKSGLVPIVTGFQGILPDSTLATLGRGGSDTTAVALGAWLHAEYVDIYTDMPGVNMADPRMILDAPMIPFLDYKSMVRLSAHGNRVLHDVSARIALEKNVRVRILSTFHDSPGTVIGPYYDEGQPDFVGAAVKGKDDVTSIVSLVYRTEKGAAGAGKILEQLKAKANPSDDPAVVIFDFPKEKVKEALETILAYYLKK